MVTGRLFFTEVLNRPKNVKIVIVKVRDKVVVSQVLGDKDLVNILFFLVENTKRSELGNIIE